MKLHIRTVLALLAALALTVGAFAQSEKVKADPAAALLQADAAWSASLTAEDKGLFNTFFLSDTRLLVSGQPIVKGAEAATVVFDGLRGLPGFECGWQASAGEVAESGELGFTVGTYELKFNDAEGNQVVDQGKYTTIWKKNAAGAWKVAVDIFNTNLPNTP